MEGLELFELNPVFFESNNVIEESPALENTIKPGNTVPTEEHHLIPNGVKNNPVIEQARNGGFKQDGAENKLTLDKFQKATGEGEHGNHPNYNNEVARRLEQFRKDNPNATPKEAAEFTRNLVKELKETINNNPGTKINDLFKTTIIQPKDATNVIKVLPLTPPGLPPSPPPPTPDPYKPRPPPPPPDPHKDDPRWT